VGSNDHLTAIRRRERAPSTTSKPDYCTAASGVVSNTSLVRASSAGGTSRLGVAVHCEHDRMTDVDCSAEVKAARGLQLLLVVSTAPGDAETCREYVTLLASKTNSR